MMTQSENLDRAAPIAGSKSGLNFCTSLESRLPNDILSLHSATVLDTFLRLVFEWIHAQCWSIPYSPPLEEISSWLQSLLSKKNLKKDIFCIDQRFFFNFTKKSKTVCHPTTFLTTFFGCHRASAAAWPPPAGLLPAACCLLGQWAMLKLPRRADLWRAGCSGGDGGEPDAVRAIRSLWSPQQTAAAAGRRRRLPAADRRRQSAGFAASLLLHGPAAAACQWLQPANSLEVSFPLSETVKGTKDGVSFGTRF